MGDDRPSRYEENGKVIYRASALGMCMKTLVALGLGHQPSPYPDWLLKRFEEGNVGEPVVLSMLSENWVFEDATGSSHFLTWHNNQPLIEVPVGTHVVIRGHADGIGHCYKNPVYEYGESDWVVGERRLVEVKCVSEDYARMVIQHLPYYYAVQIATYSHALGFKPMLALGIKDETGKVINVTTEMIEPEVSMAQIKRRVIEIESYIERGELPACDHPVWPCPFSWMCDGDWGEGVEFDDKIQQVIEAKIERVRVYGQSPS